jgi:hypothetical protein
VRTPEGDPGNCRFTCREAPRVCGALDGQCPANCGPAQDRDCPGCGNNRPDPGETCDPCRPEDVQACVGDANTIRTPAGSAAACTFSCSSTPRPCASGDGFCPAGCTRANDSDCLPGRGEACTPNVACGEGSCVDGRCCVQTCGICQSCTGAAGTCVNIPMGLPDNEPARSCVAPLSCNGVGACQQPNCEINLMPGKHDFGAIAVGGSSQIFTFTVRTSCPTTVNPTSSNPREFIIVTNGCVGGVGPGKPCTLGVQFQPAAAGSRTGVLTVAMAAGASVGASASASLGGTGQVATLGWKPTGVQFGKVPVGTRATQGITLFNSGATATGPLTITTAPPFMIAQNGCQAPLAPGQTCELVMMFFPQKDGPANGTVVASAPGGVSGIAQLDGVGVAEPVQALTITPSSHGFGGVPVNGRSGPARFQITAGIDLQDLNVVSSSSEFVIAETNCSLKAGLPAGKSCVVAVVFAPTVAGQKQASLSATARQAGIFIVAPPLQTASSSLTGTGTLRILDPLPRPPPVLAQ